MDKSRTALVSIATNLPASPNPHRMKSSVRFALPLAVLLMLGACGESPESLLAKARQDFAAENYAQARTRLVAALEDRPGDREMLALLAETQLRLGDPDSAERAVERFERAGGQGAVLARMKAETALLRQDPRRALALLGADKSPDAWRIRAGSHLALGDEGAARAAFEQGIAVGGDVRLGAAYGRFLLLGEDFARAAWVLGRMQASAPRSYEAMVMAADLAAAQGRDGDAAAAYRKAVDAFPDRIAPMLALANQYDAAGRVDDAAKLVDQAAQVAPGDPQVEELHIQLLSEKGEWQAIREALQGRESSLPAGSALSMTYGEALLRLGHPEQARAIFRRAVLVLPGNPYSRLMLGEAQLATGDARGAWASLAPLAATTLAPAEVLRPAEQAARAVGADEAAALQARLDPARLKATMALVGQGEAALERQDWAAAAGVYERLLARGDDPEILKRLAMVKSRLGDAAAAIGYADRAVAHDPGNPDYLYIAGAARLEGGRDLPGARRLLEAAAAVDPANRAIARELRKAKAAAG